MSIVKDFSVGNGYVFYALHNSDNFTIRAPMKGLMSGGLWRCRTRYIARRYG